MQINLLHKVLYFVLNHKLINLKYFDCKILQDKFCVYISQIHYGSILAANQQY